MPLVFIHGIGVSTTATKPVNLDVALSVRDHRNSNCFWIAASPGEYPCLNILVRGRDAVMHYIPVERSAGSQSRSPKADDAGGESVTFYADQSDEPTTLPASACVPSPMALAAAHEFARTLARPTCVDWSEL